MSEESLVLRRVALGHLTKSMLAVSLGGGMGNFIGLRQIMRYECTTRTALVDSTPHTWTVSDIFGGGFQVLRQTGPFQIYMSRLCVCVW